MEVVRGIHRHVVRFVEYDGRLYALKELPARLAQREWTLLRRLAAENQPVVEVVGRRDAPGARGGPDHAPPRVLAPVPHLFENRAISDFRQGVMNAGAELLVRLHTAGFFWGDASLSNTLFRRDAGGLAAYLVDAETGELHTDLSAGSAAVRPPDPRGERRRRAARRGGRDRDRAPSSIPWETATELVERYESLWTELTRDELFGADERWKVDERLRRLNELGFDVEEIELLSTDERLPATSRADGGRAGAPSPAAASC